MSKHTYLGARIPIELITNTHLNEIGSHFPKWPTKRHFSITPACSSLRIVILVSKHTYLGARIPVELNANNYLREIGSHFPKWPTKRHFSITPASSSLRIVILMSKHTYLGARIPIELNANIYLYEICSQGRHFGAAR